MIFYLRKEFDELRDKYISELARRLEIDGAEVKVIGEGFEDVISFNDEIFLSFETVRYMIDNNITTSTFYEWWGYVVKVGMLGIKPPSLKDFWKGCPLRSEEELAEMEKTQKRIEELEEDLKKMINNASY